MKPVNNSGNAGTYIDYSVEHDGKDPKFKVCDYLRISKKVNNNVPWTYVISDIYGEEIVKTFYEKEKKRENIIKRKGYKIYIKRNGCDNSVNSWINMKDII